MRLFNTRFILGVLISSLFISSCSSTDELVISEKSLQSAIENKVGNCDSLYALYSFTAYAEINISYGEESEKSNIKNANLVKEYIFKVLEISKFHNHFNKTEYLKELESIAQEIDETDLPDNKLERIGKKYFPDCGYFLADKVPTLPQKRTPLVESPMAMDRNELACNTYYEAFDKVNQLPWTSPKIPYILKNGYIQAMRYADDDLALNFQILIDGGPNSSGAIVDIAQICGQYR